MIKLSITLNNKTLEREFTNEKELIATADEMKKSRKDGSLRFKDRLHREFYDMIQDNADGYRQNTSEELTYDDLGFVKKAKVSASAAERAHTAADAEKSMSKEAPADRKATAERKYKEALAAAQAETEEYQKTVARLSKELKEADEKHMEAKAKLEEAKREYLSATLNDFSDDYYSNFYDLLSHLFGEKDED